MWKLFCNSQNTTQMLPHLTALYTNLGVTFEDNSSRTVRTELSNNDMSLCILHAAPTESEIRSVLASNADKYSIVINISRYGSLKISSEFTDRLALFFWPMNYAEGIGSLGTSLFNKFGHLNSWAVDAESVRKFIEHYFRNHFEVEHQIAAYILRHHYHDNEANAKDAILEVGVRNEIAELSLEDLEVKIKNLVTLGS